LGESQKTLTKGFELAKKANNGHVEGATAIGAAFGAIESLMENLAVEVSPAGVRVVCLRTTADIDSRTIQQTVGVLACCNSTSAGVAPAIYTADGKQAVAYIAATRTYTFNPGQTSRIARTGEYLRLCAMPRAWARSPIPRHRRRP
jgi:NAD(P)-dependent dehydrogenase (short-subunit alcohol dehydrogenase family)